MMLVCDTRIAIDLPQSDCQSERKTFGCRAAGAPHDGDSESDVIVRGDFKLLDVERLSGVVEFEEQIPRLFSSIPVDCSAGGTSNITISRS